MRGDIWYQFVSGMLDLFVWGGKLVGEENLPKEGPAVFVANHLEAVGPIAAVCSIPLRLYPWIIGDMIDCELAPQWLEWDFVQRTLHLTPPASRWVAKALSRFTVPLLRSFGCIPIYQGYDNVQKTWDESLPRLMEDKFLLIFPEDKTNEVDLVTKMSPFQKSFVRLGEIYYEKTGKRLKYYPVAIHGSGVVMVGKPLVHNPFNPVGLERHRLKDLMEETVKRMYLQIEGSEEMVGALTPQHK